MAQTSPPFLIFLLNLAPRLQWTAPCVAVAVVQMIESLAAWLTNVVTIANIHPQTPPYDR